MKNKAFTLVELLGVIIILGIIATITFPLVQSTILESSENAYDEQVASFKRAAKNYVAADVYKMTGCGTIIDCDISLQTLQNGGYLPAGDIINPKTDENFNLSNVVIIKYENGKFSYTYDTTQDE